MEFRNLDLSAFSEVNKAHASAELEHLAVGNSHGFTLLRVVCMVVHLARCYYSGVTYGYRVTVVCVY